MIFNLSILLHPENHPNPLQQMRYREEQDR